MIAGSLAREVEAVEVKDRADEGRSTGAKPLVWVPVEDPNNAKGSAVVVEGAELLRKDWAGGTRAVMR